MEKNKNKLVTMSNLKKSIDNTNGDDTTYVCANINISWSAILTT